MSEAAIKLPNDEIKFFPEEDKGYGKGFREGRVKSYMPCWYLETHVEEIDQELSELEARLKLGLVRDQDAYETRNKINELREKKDRILAGKPQLSVGERDRLNKVYKTLETMIGDTLFTRSQMHLRLADPGQELKRMTEYIIPVPQEMETLFASANVKIINKKVTRNGAAKLFKLCGKLLGEPTNIEVLRKDGGDPGRRPYNRKGHVY